ncbi:hypothetical protein QFZ38_004555 [Pseudomonas cedrina]|nr:hypothetical protein [Pseudomonas cedrina]
MVAVERGVQVAHHLAHFFALTADDDAVRAAAVGDGRAFLEKLRVGDDIEFQVPAGQVQGLFDVCTQGVAGADGHGGFLHQNYRVPAVPGYRIAHRQHVLQVSRAIFVRRRAHGDKQHLAMFDGQLLVKGEMQAPALQVLLHHRRQPRLEDAHMALLQQLDLVLVDVHANDVVTHLGQYSGLHQADVTTTKYTDFHGAFLGLVALARRELITNTPKMTNATPRVFETEKSSLNTGRLAASRYTSA